MNAIRCKNRATGRQGGLHKSSTQKQREISNQQLLRYSFTSDNMHSKFYV